MFLPIDNKRHILFLPDSFVREEEQLEGLDFSTSVQLFARYCMYHKKPWMCFQLIH